MLQWQAHLDLTCFFACHTSSKHSYISPVSFLSCSSGKHTYISPVFTSHSPVASRARSHLFFACHAPVAGTPTSHLLWAFLMSVHWLSGVSLFHQVVFLSVYVYLQTCFLLWHGRFRVIFVVRSAAIRFLFTGRPPSSGMSGGKLIALCNVHLLLCCCLYCLSTSSHMVNVNHSVYILSSIFPILACHMTYSLASVLLIRLVIYLPMNLLNDLYLQSLLSDSCTFSFMFRPHTHSPCFAHFLCNMYTYA